MSYRPSILFVTEATYQDVERVIEAQGRGAGTFTYGMKLVSISDPNGPVVARMCQDMTATPALEASWRAYAASGDLPDITGVWGEGGVIGAAAAQAAHTGLTVYSAAGEVPEGWAAAVRSLHDVMVQPEAV